MEPALVSWEVGADGSLRRDSKLGQSDNLSICETDRLYAGAQWPRAFITAKCPGECGPGPFTDPCELSVLRSLSETVDGKQPAVRHPRTNWNHWDPAHPVRYNVGLAPAQVHATCIEVPESEGFKGSRPSVKWKIHCERLADLLLDVQKNAMIGSPGLLRLLSMASYGMNDIVVSHDRTMVITDSDKFVENKPQGDGYNDLLPQAYLRSRSMLRSPTFSGFGDPLQWRHVVQHKRFFLALVHHQDHSHWTVLTWDRHAGQLYLHDTLSPGATEHTDRFRSVLYAWREWLAMCGLPYDFDAFSVPLTRQPGGWECGVLAITAAANSIRGLVGAPYRQLRSTSRTVDGRFSFASGQPCLPFRDWVPAPDKSRDLKQARDDLMHMTSAWVLEEMGVKDASFFGPEYGKYTTDLVAKEFKLQHLSTITQVTDQPSTITVDDIWTRPGGYNHIFVRNIGQEKGQLRRRAVALDADNLTLFRSSKEGPAAGQLSTMPASFRERLESMGYDPENSVVPVLADAGKPRPPTALLEAAPSILGSFMGQLVSGPEDDEDEDDHDAMSSSKELGDVFFELCYRPGRWGMLTNESRRSALLPSSRTYAPYIPDGLMAASSWDNIVRKLSEAFK